MNIIKIAKDKIDDAKRCSECEMNNQGQCYLYQTDIKNAVKTCKNINGNIRKTDGGI